MTSRSRSQPEPTEPKSMALIKQSIPVMLTDLATFDDGYALLKDGFKREMMKIDQQMKKFSSDLMKIYVETNIGNTAPQYENSFWDVLKTSPLLIGEGQEKILRLQFDVGHFDPEEVNVKVLDDTLIVTASHEEKTADTTVYREYNRQFKLPPALDPNELISTLSLDGVLTVEVPITMPPSDDTDSSVAED